MYPAAVLDLLLEDTCDEDQVFCEEQICARRHGLGSEFEQLRML